MNKHLEEIHAVLKTNNYYTSKQTLLSRFGISESTLRRVFRDLREIYGAPLVYDKENDGYRYSDEKFELDIPSFWASSETLLALISVQNLLSQMQLDIIDKHLGDLKDDIERHLKKKKISTNEIDRIRILPITARISNHTHFQQAASALLQRNQLNITYHARGSDDISQRVISPQRLAHYKDNWYLDAWCHLRKELRTFALDRIRSIEIQHVSCHEVSEDILNQYLASGYGIFSGKDINIATLIFSAARARWVADEKWHPNQECKTLIDGRYQLKVPYSDERELLMDIMRHLPEVEITAPESLKKALNKILKLALEQNN